jgi:hypothetical protein
LWFKLRRLSLFGSEAVLETFRNMFRRPNLADASIAISSRSLIDASLMLHLW